MYSPITIDSPCRLLVTDLVAGWPWLVPVADWSDVDLLTLLDSNPVVSHGHSIVRPNVTQELRELKARGGYIVVVDPRETGTAKLADLHLPVRPGSDPSILAFLIREVLTHEPDNAFLLAATEPASVATLRTLVEPFSLNVAADRCGVDPMLLSRLSTVLREGTVALTV
jgi:anaerobic selenocysteine-containing dehydrogenase